MSDLDGLGTLFFEVHRDLPREGPGSTASTRRALELARPRLPAAPRVVDAACGPGAQTLVLLDALPEASITAFDLHGPFVDQLRTSLADRPGADRVRTLEADMRTFEPPAPVDLVWCEGAVWILGVENALSRFREWLGPRGVVAFSEAVLLVDRPSPAVAELWEEYPAIGPRDRLVALVQRLGFRVLGSFVEPEEDWWTYYRPVEARLERLEAAHAGDADALAELAMHRREVEVFRAHPDEYSYLFVVAQRTDRSSSRS